MAKGKLMYVPKVVISEIDDILAEEGITGKRGKSKAMVEMVKYARVGREANRIMRLRFR